MATENGEYVTVSEAAQECGVSPGRMRMYIIEGRIHATALNPRMKVIARDELERFKAIPRLTGKPGHRIKS